MGEPAPPTLITASGRTRLIVADIEVRAFPRELALIELEASGSVRISNKHTTTPFEIIGHNVLNPSQSQSLAVLKPVVLLLPAEYSLEISKPHNLPNTTAEDDDNSLARTRLRRPDENLRPQAEVQRQPSSSLNMQTLARAPLSSMSSWKSDSISKQGIQVDVFLDWLDRVMIALQRPVTHPNFFSGIAEAASRIVGLDRAEIILWNGQQWNRNPAYSYVSDRLDSGMLSAPSRTMLDLALQRTEIVVYPDSLRASQVGEAESLRGLVSAIACPILGENGETVGVFYGDRALQAAGGQEHVSNVEEKLVEILVTAIAQGMVRAKREQLVATYQQFFSTKVTDAIRRDPKLLEGEDCEVSVLFCDIRGFSRVTDQIGPAAAMRWVHDTLSELSVHVLESDGVLVDFVGDELLSMWGAPDRSPDHAFRAAFAARKMMNLRTALSARWRELIPGGVDFGIGICTGLARVGNTGSSQKFKYGPMGRTVNLGSRIQGLTKQWKVRTLIDGPTERLLPPDMLRRRICRARVIGMDGDIDLYELFADDDEQSQELKRDYETALSLFEAGEHRQATRAFGDLAQRYPKDGPSLQMLVRAVKQLAEPSNDFESVWIATEK